MTKKKQKAWGPQKFLIREKTVVSVILLYAITLFFDGFSEVHEYSVRHFHFLYWIEYTCTIYFIIEAILKIQFWGFRRYWAGAWNKFDFYHRHGKLAFTVGAD